MIYIYILLHQHQLHQLHQKSYSADISRPRAASINSESQFGNLLSPKQMEDRIMSQWHNRNSISEHSHTRKKTPYNDKSSQKDKEGNKKWSLSFGKGNKKRNSKSKKIL